jgi:hypothetical protein
MRPCAKEWLILKSQDIVEAEGVFMLEPLPCGVFVKLLALWAIWPAAGR